MDESPTPTNPKHLHSAEDVARATTDPPRTRARGRRQGNGLRVHGIYFAVVSLAVLVGFIVIIFVVSSMM